MNRPSELDRALSSVRQGTRQPDQLIVSDDGHQDAARAVAEKYGATYQHGPARGLGANRNACLSVVTSTHVAFIDDDVEVSPEFTAEISEAASNDVITGWEMNHADGGPRRVQPSDPSFLGFQKVTPVGDPEGIVINATVFPTSLFATARFNEQVSYGYEELDIARQARAAGFNIKFNDRQWVNHYPSPVNRDRYARVLVASRLYLTARAYWRYERKPLKTMAFCVVAGAQQVASGVRRRQGLRGALRPVGLAMSYAWRGRS